MTQKHLFIIDTISTFRMKYAIEAECIDHAYDEVTMKDSGNPADSFDEITQLHLGEQIIDGRQVSHAELTELLAQLNNNVRESAVPVSSVDRCIRKIKYNK